MSESSPQSPPPPSQPSPPQPDATQSDSVLSPNVSLYVGDLHPDVTETELHEAFQKSGFEATVRICRDVVSSKSLGYAYVNFVSSSQAGMALECLNHTELKGKPMRIMWSVRDSLSRKTGVGNLFVKNLHPSVTGVQLEDIFGKYGTIMSCKLAEDNGKSKGFGFVQFELEESAIDALNALHDSIVEGKKLYVSKFVKKSERNAAKGEEQYTNVYVKNLTEDFTENGLQDMFSKFGNVSSAVIMKDNAGESRGFGFVNFELPEQAKQAVDALNGTPLGSKNLFVARAQKKAEREELLKREYQQKVSPIVDKSMALNLYVKNLDLSINDQKLKECFSVCGQVTSAKVMCDYNGTSKGFGFVSFSRPEEARKALAILNGSYFQGRYLFVGIAQAKEERQKLLESRAASYPVSPYYFPKLESSYLGSHPPIAYPFPTQIYHHPCYPYASRDHYPYMPLRQNVKGMHPLELLHPQYMQSTTPYPNSQDADMNVSFGRPWIQNRKQGITETGSAGARFIARKPFGGHFPAASNRKKFYNVAAPSYSETGPAARAVYQT